MKKIPAFLVALCTIGALGGQAKTTIQDSVDQEGAKPAFSCGKDGSAAYSYFCKSKSYKEIDAKPAVRKKARHRHSKAKKP